MSNVLFVFDGITLQHAGELLFDAPSTVQQRRVCSSTYVRCLEDFAFAVLYGTSFAHTGSFPKVQADEPGLILCRTYKTQFHHINANSQIAPETLLTIPIFRMKIAKDMKSLHLALQRQPIFWEHWMVRETQAYFGNDKSIFLVTEPHLYEYTRKPKYMNDRQLQNLIPVEFINYLSQVVRRHLPIKEVTEQAIHEFVSRTALTHQVMFWWLELLPKDSQDNISVRLPHITRSLLRTVQLSTKRDDAIRSSRDVIARHALVDAMAASTTREDVVHRLQDFRDLKPYPWLREKLSELFVELDSEKVKKSATRLLDEIRRVSAEKDDSLDPIKVAIEVPFTLGSVKVEYPIQMQTSSTKRVLRQIVGRWNANEYFLQLKRIFPELEFS